MEQDKYNISSFFVDPNAGAKKKAPRKDQSDYVNDALVYIASHEKEIQDAFRSLSLIVMSLVGRRYVRKALEAAGVESNEAKILSRALPWAAYLVGINAALGVKYGSHLGDDVMRQPKGESVENP